MIQKMFQPICSLDIIYANETQYIVNATTKLALKTGGLSALYTVIALCFAIGIFSYITPSTMAKFYGALGDTRLQAIYLERTYNRDKNVDNLYNVLLISVTNKDQSKTIKFGNKFFSKDRTEFTDTKDAEMFAQTGIPVNTDDFLRRALIKALVERGKGGDQTKAEQLCDGANDGHLPCKVCE